MPHLNSLSDTVLQVMAYNADRRDRGEGQNDDDEEDDEDGSSMEEDDEDEEGGGMHGRRGMERNTDDDDHSFDQFKPQQGSTMQAGGKGTKDEYSENRLKAWERSMPPEARAIWNTAKQATVEKKHAIVMRLIAHMTDPKRRNLVGNRLMRLSPRELQERLELLPPAPAWNQNVGEYTTGVGWGSDMVGNSNDQFGGDDPIFLGANAPVTTNSGGDLEGVTNETQETRDLRDAPLEPPTMNFAEWAKENRQRRA